MWVSGSCIIGHFNVIRCPCYSFMSRLLQSAVWRLRVLMSWVWTRTKAALRHKTKPKNVHYKLVSIPLYTAIRAKLYICLTALSSRLRNHTASCFHTADAKVSGQLVSRTPKCTFMKLFTDTQKSSCTVFASEVWLMHTRTNKPTHTLFMQMVCMRFYRPTFESSSCSRLKNISMRVSVSW